MRGEILLTALEILEEVAYSTGDFIKAFLNSSKTDYRNLKVFPYKDRQTLAEKIRQDIQDRKKFDNLLFRLKKDELIFGVKESEDDKKWKLTRKGADKLQKLRKTSAVLPKKEYKKEGSPNLIIVTFDVPEIERHKREWLRNMLYNLGFKMLQKSVLVGKIKLPEEFIADLKKTKIVDYVEIFAVTKSGTIKHLI